MTKFVSSVIANGSSPLKRVRRGGEGILRGATPSTDALIARV